MTEIIDNLTFYIYMFLLLVIAFSVVGGLVAFIFYNKRKKGSRDMVDAKNPKSKIRPTFDLIEPDDIIDGMYVLDEGKTYVMIVRAFGCEYHSSFSDEKNKIEFNYTEMWNIVNEPLQYHMQSRKNNIDTTISRYNNALLIQTDKKLLLERELAELNSNLKSYDLENLDKQKNVEYDLLSTRKVEVEKQLGACTLLIQSLSEQLNRMQFLVNNREYPKRHHYYVLSYSFNALNFGVELSRAEIRERAKLDLLSKANGIINSLGRANTYSYILTGDELVDVLRKHFRPYSGDDFRYKNFRETNIDQVVTTDDRNETREEFLQRSFTEFLVNELAQDNAEGGAYNV